MGGNGLELFVVVGLLFMHSGSVDNVGVRTPFEGP